METELNEEDDEMLANDPVYQVIRLLNAPQATPTQLSVEQLTNPEDPLLTMHNQIRELTRTVEGLRGDLKGERKQRVDAEEKLRMLVEFFTFLQGEYGKLITNLVSMTVKNSTTRNMLNMGPFQDEGEAGEFFDMLQDLAGQFQNDFKSLAAAEDLLAKADVILRGRPNTKLIDAIQKSQEGNEQRRSSVVSTVIVEPSKPVELPILEGASRARRTRRGTYHTIGMIKDEYSQDLSFVNKTHGVDHSKRHWGHYCLCGSKLSTRKTLHQHIRYLTAERTVKCGMCSKRFVGKSYLRTHMKTAHKVCTDLMVTCSKCKQEFQSRKELAAHFKAGNCVQ